MHVHSCLSLVEIPHLHVNPPYHWNSNCKYTPTPSDFPSPSDSKKLSVVWYAYYLELPNLFIILGSKMQLIGIGYLQANPLQAKKSTRTRARNNFQRVSGNDDRPNSFLPGHVSYLARQIYNS